MRDILFPLRRIHGAIHENKNTLVLEAFFKSLKKNNEVENYPVDFVVLWVDGEDPSWLAEKEKYTKNDEQEERNNASCRYRDWGLFQYWFRAVEQYAPWVRYVHLVTWGHVPSWINTDHPKLRVVKHEEFIPEQYLPTFSSQTIGLNIWRIKGLSEHFVVFEDDLFLINPVSKETFFTGGFPNLCAIAEPIYPYIGMTSHVHARMNNYALFGSLFDIKKVISDNPEKWFSYKYGKKMKYNIRAYKDGRVPGMYYSHSAVPMRVLSCEECSKALSYDINQTCLHKFRTSYDIFREIFPLWEIFHGTFEPVGALYYGVMSDITFERIVYLEDRIMNSHFLVVCANDGESITKNEFYQLQANMKTIMEKKYPQKSSFEI